MTVFCTGRYALQLTPRDLQLDRLQKLELDWMMSFNRSKCEVIRVTKKRNPITANFIDKI